MSIEKELQGAIYRVSGEYKEIYKISGSYILDSDGELANMNLTISEEKIIVGTLTFNESRLNIHAADYEKSTDVIGGLYPVFLEVIDELGGTGENE